MRRTCGGRWPSQVRRLIHEFSVSRAEGPLRDLIRHLVDAWGQLNDRHFSGRLSPAYISVTEPRSPRAWGDCSKWSGHGGRLQIRIRTSHVRGDVNRDKPPPPGKSLRYMPEGHDLKFRLRHLEDILLHEMGHQAEYELLGTEAGHGHAFAEICNRISDELGLGHVVIRRRKGDPRDLPICSEWPHNVRPSGWYGDLWATRSTPAEEGDAWLSRMLAMWPCGTPEDQAAFLASPIVNGGRVSTNGAGASAPEPSTWPATVEDIKPARQQLGWGQIKLGQPLRRHPEHHQPA